MFIYIPAAPTTLEKMFDSELISKANIAPTTKISITRHVF